MQQQLACLGLLALVVSGCALCADPHDCKFVAYGGVRQRTDMVHGRVGSVFDPAPEVNNVVRPPVDLLPLDEEDDDDRRDGEGSDATDSGGSDGLGTGDGTDSGESGSDTDSRDLPGLDGEGSIELPELDGGSDFPDLPNTEGERDAETGLRSARRHPLSDLFDDQF